MAKSKITSKDKSKQEVIKPVPYEDEMEIIRKVKTDGTVVYQSSFGSNIKTSSISLCELFSSFLDSFAAIVNLADNDSYSDFGCALEGLIQGSKRQLEETFTFLDRTIGYIDVDFICRGNWPYRTGRIVKASVSPPEKATGGEVSL